jgi:glycosyltransferase involved in cell wall biosynthesis
MKQDALFRRCGDGSHVQRERRQRLLVLAPRLPYPVVGGDRLRIHRVCRELAKEFDLTLIALCESREEACCPLIDDGVFVRVERVHLPKWRSWMNCVLALPRREPLQVAYYRSPECKAVVEALAPQHDGVLVHLIRMSEYARHLDVPRFLEMTDAISLNYDRVRRVGARTRKLQSLVYSIEARRLYEYERSAAQAFDVSVLVSHVDRAHLFPSPSDAPWEVLVCANGVDATDLPYRFDPAACDIAFIGNLTSVQNLDAACYFASDVLPLIRARAPNVRFRVVGRIAHRAGAKLSALEGVDVTGEVPSIPDAVRGCGVGVCPLRLGAGVQNKVLEYMALGLPVVTTSVGLEGLEARPGFELMVADGAADFAGAVLELVSDRERALTLAVAARRHVESTHAWAPRLRPMVDAIREALFRRNGGRDQHLRARRSALAS